MVKKNAFIVVLFTLLMVSCNKDTEMIYSCNETINNWVEENLDEIHLMTRADWYSLPKNHKTAAYRAFTFDQRLAFWKEKLTEVKSLEGWSKEEILHIEKVEKYLYDHLYLLKGDYLTDEQADELDKFFYLWQNYAIENLGWTKQTCIAIAGNGNKMTNKAGDVSNKGSYEPNLNEPDNPEDCNCNVTYDFCWPIEYCEDLTCISSSSGCGWFFASSCNGVCK